MRNNKGFTLIELLIIIVIISIIIGITIPSILLINNKVKNKLYNNKVASIVSAAEIYGSENNKIFYGTNIAKVYVGEFINENYLESEKECSVYITIDDGSTIFTKGCIHNPIDNNDMNNNYVILLRQASSDNNTYSYIGYFNREGYNFEENINSNSYAVLIYLKNGNNVQGNMNTKTYKINDSVVLDNNKFTREGYDFIGWCTTVKCENDKLLQPLDTVTNLVRNNYARSYIYAEWEAKEYNINYNLDNGILLKQNPTYYTTESEFKLNNPIKSGYRFIGWIENEGDTPKEIFNVFKGTIGDKTFTAIYELDNYTLTLDCGSGVGSSVTNTYNANETPILSSIGCYFVDELNNSVYYQTGWSNEYGNYDMDSKYTFYSNGNNEIKLTATWNKLFDITGNYVVVNEKNGNWKVKILGSENNTFGKASIVFNIETNIDIFLVGGGAGGRFYYLDWDTKIFFPCFGAGGGSGYTKTFKEINLIKNKDYLMNIGAGGSAGSRSHIDASKGNNTTFENYVANCGAAGSNVLGGKGGSGGGSNGGYCLAGGIGGINGGKGGNSVDNKGKNGGPGQGSNTCEFGEMNGNECVEGNTYSTGGAGGKARQTALIPNSGNGGNGGVGLYDNVDNKAYRCNNPTINPTAGSSGIIVIRNAR